MFYSHKLRSNRKLWKNTIVLLLFVVFTILFPLEMFYFLKRCGDLVSSFVSWTNNSSFTAICDLSHMISIKAIYTTLSCSLPWMISNVGFLVLFRFDSSIVCIALIYFHSTSQTQIIRVCCRKYKWKLNKNHSLLQKR